MSYLKKPFCSQSHSDSEEQNNCPKVHLDHLFGIRFSPIRWGIKSINPIRAALPDDQLEPLKICSELAPCTGEHSDPSFWEGRQCPGCKHLAVCQHLHAFPPEQLVPEYLAGDDVFSKYSPEKQQSFRIEFVQAELARALKAQST